MVIETIQLLTHVFVKITHGEILELIMNVNIVERGNAYESSSSGGRDGRLAGRQGID